MTFEPPEGPLPDLTTTRVAGGAAARVIAVAVASVLIAVVGFAVVNRPAPPAAPSATSGPVAVVPTPVPTPSPPHNQIEGNDGIFGWPVVAELPLSPPSRPVTIDRSPTYTYAVLTEMIGATLRAPLKPGAADVYAGSMIIGSTATGDSLMVNLGRQWQQDGLTIFGPFDSWPIDLTLLRESRGQVELLVIQQPPNTDPGVPGPVASGYAFTVLGERDGTRLTLSMELVVPAAAQFAVYAGSRDPASYNRCRWDVGPLAAPPRPGTDEADC